MRRFIFNFTAGMSFVLFVLAVAIWVRSWYATDSFIYLSRPALTRAMVWSALAEQGGGRIILCTRYYRPQTPWMGQTSIWKLGQPADKRNWTLWPGPDAVGYYSILGFAIYFEPIGSPGEWELLIIPLYAIAGIALLLPLRWVQLKIRRRRENFCAQCRYDLRGNPAASACPECGAKIDGKPDAGHTESVARMA